MIVYILAALCVYTCKQVNIYIHVHTCMRYKYVGEDLLATMGFKIITHGRQALAVESFDGESAHGSKTVGI